MTQKTTQNPWTMDVRVRERNLKSGILGQKELEKYLAQLQDCADQAEAFATPQPALEAPDAPEQESDADESLADSAHDPVVSGTPAVPVTNGEGSL